MNVRNCIVGTTNANALRFGQGCEGPYYVIAPSGYITQCPTLEDVATYVVIRGYRHEQPVDVRERLTQYELQMLELCKISYHKQCLPEMRTH